MTPNRPRDHRLLVAVAVQEGNSPSRTSQFFYGMPGRRAVPKAPVPAKVGWSALKVYNPVESLHVDSTFSRSQFGCIRGVRENDAVAKEWVGTMKSTDDLERSLVAAPGFFTMLAM